MDEQSFQDKFSELINKINQLPVEQRARLEKLAEETRDRRKRIQQSVGQLQESLDHLRLSVKYLVFDLEATRRENAYLRRLVGQMNRDKNQQRDHESDQDNDNFIDGDEF